MCVHKPCVLGVIECKTAYIMQVGLSISHHWQLHCHRGHRSEWVLWHLDCGPVTDDSFISTSEPLTPTAAARLDEAILSLGPRSSAYTITDTAATDLATITIQSAYWRHLTSRSITTTTITPAMTRPYRVKRGSALARAGNLASNAKITNYFMPPDID